MGQNSRVVLLALFIVAALAYGAAAFAYGSGPPGERGGRWGRAALAAGALLHFGLIGAQCLDGDHPLRSVFLAVNFGSFMAVVGYLVLSWKGRLDGLGSVLAPVGLVGLALGVVFADHGVQRLPGTEAVARAHVLLATAGVAGFTLAAGVAGLYLGMERRLRNKVFRPGGRGMSLTGLDRLHHLLVLVVTPVFTLAIVTGVLWILNAGGIEHLAGRSFELVAAGTAWTASVFLLVSRAVWGMRGRRSAVLTLVSFAAVLLVLAYYGVRTA